jgi:thiol-disulfide isomerase/thioredoxin
MVSDITMEELTANAFLQDGVLRVVMFFGPTCGPCKATMPFYEQVADSYTKAGAKMLFYRIDAWNPPEQRQFCTDTWGIQGVPHFKIMYNGTVVADRVGGGDVTALHASILYAINVIFAENNVRS